VTRPRTLQQLIEGVALAAPAKQRWPTVTVRHGAHQAYCLGIATGRRVRLEGAVIMGVPGGKVAGKLGRNNLLELL
jgi:hypothetical protein